ncbi:short-chain dehydrogenase [Paenibacillus chartarius]|uniref:Short-chain dehydrogenase n=1 Tax=Paenibacillus chartarius TaxID=747481 RepID=A0ABV6DVM2_9BACL
MPCVHEFGIMDDFDTEKEYNKYEPQKYNCISVDDDIINCLVVDLMGMKSYFHSFHRPEYGLALWGITIIPPESLSLFYDVVISSNDYQSSVELSYLASKILLAIEDQKYMIHFGV